MRSKKLVCALALCLACSFSSTIKADVNEDVQNAQAQYREYQNKIEEVNTKVYALNNSIQELVYSIESTDQKIADTKIEIEVGEGLVEQSKKDIEARERLKDKRVREMYKSTAFFDYIDVLFSSKNLSDFISYISSA